MEQAVYLILSESLSSDNAIRNAATQKLTELEDNNLEFAGALAKILSSNECEAGIRQSAGVTLKNYINKHWSKSADYFSEPMPPDNVKSIVRELSFHTLSSNIYKVRAVAALIVAKIAHFDWPEEWSNFIDLLLQLIAKGDRLAVNGGMKVFSYFVDKDLSDQQIGSVGPILFPELFKIASSDNGFSYQTRMYAVEVFSGMIYMINTVKEENPDFEQTLLAPIFPSWLEYFSNVLTNCEINNVTIGLLVQIVIALQYTMDYFPRQLLGKEAHFANLILSALEKISDAYVISEVYGNELPESWYVKSNSDEGGEDRDNKFEDFIYPAFDFFTTLSSKKNKSAKDALTQEPISLSRIFWVIFKLHQVTSVQVEEWEEDPNKFAIDEDDEYINYSIRLTAMDLCNHLIGIYGAQSISELSSACGAHIQAATAQRQAGNSNWWLIIESCVSLIGSGSYDIIETYDSNKESKPFDIGTFFSTVVLPLMTLNEFPIAQGRAFVFASQYGSILPQDLALQCLNHSINMMKNATSILVNISGLKAVSNFCSTLSKNLLIPIAHDLFESTCSISSKCKGEILNLLLETWSSIIKISPEITVKYSQFFIPKLLETWIHSTEDTYTALLVREVIKELAGNTEVYPLLVSSIVPPLVKILSDPSANTQILSCVVDTFSSLIEGGPSPLPQGFVANLLLPVLSCIGKKDQDLELCVQEFLKNLIIMDLNQIISWEHNGQNGLTYIINYVSTLLNNALPEDEGAIMYCGTLILTLLLKNTEATIPYLKNLLTPLVARLITTKSQMLRQDFIMVIAQLCRTHLDVILDFLFEETSPNHCPKVQALTIWLENHDSFSGYFQIKLSAYALAQIFVKNDPRLDTLKCKWKLIDINPGKIITRSQTRATGEHYTMLPASAKILTLLIADYRNDAYTTEANPLYTQEESEWQDVDEDDGNYLSDFDYGRNEDEEHFKHDPLYKFELKEYLGELFKAGISNNTGNLQHYATLLEKTDQETLRSLQ
ncbi:ARM repeat-containing protein [Neoconidiobolus thromboides FSU 785]|nr:ARM repeat-containing protein [Neoconidiobolus thromboides FSU 785]